MGPSTWPAWPAGPRIRHSIDGGKTWIVDEPQPVAKTLLEGLPAGVEVEIQVAVKDSKGQSTWTQSFPITLLK